MFEDKTRSLLQESMLSEVSNDYDKTDGFFIYDALKPTAIELERLYITLDQLINKLDIENLNGVELDLYVFQRTGVERRKATHAVGLVTVQGEGVVNEGDLFETTVGVQFRAIETKQINGTGTISVKAVLEGTEGNVPANQIISMPVTLNGIIIVTNTNRTIDGYNEESDKELRQRYYERVRTPATSANIYHYRNWAKEVQGVGDAKVFPLWNGDNTVKVVIIDVNKQPTSRSLVDDVQNYIDPGITGSGNGVAPIGAFCTVESATTLDINLSFSVTLDEAYTQQQMIDNVKINVTNYLKTIAFTQDYVSYARLGSIILNSEGVSDYSNLKVNSGVTNVSVQDSQIAVLGGVIIV